MTEFIREIREMTKKIAKEKRPDEEHATGVVVWDVEVTNQNDARLVLYLITIQSLVEMNNV